MSEEGEEELGVGSVRRTLGAWEGRVVAVLVVLAVLLLLLKVV
jgi:hypothetical protein